MLATPSLQAVAQEVAATNSPKERYDALIIEQQSISSEIIECQNAIPQLSKRKAKKMSAYTDKLIMQKKSIDLQISMYPKSFTDPQSFSDQRKALDDEFRKMLDLKVKQLEQTERY